VPERRAVFDPWLREDDVCLIHADAGVGKSWYVMSLALAIASASDVFNGHGCGAPVLYVDGEMGLSEYQQRTAQLCRSLGLDATGVAPMTFWLGSHPEATPEEFPRIDDPAGRELIERQAVTANARVVVLDNLRTLTSGLDENDAAPMQDINRWLKRLAIGRAVVLVHHNNKGGKFSGTTALETIVATRVNLQRHPPTTQGNACFRALFEKNRHGIYTDATADTVWELDRRDGWIGQRRVAPEQHDDVERFREQAEGFAFGSASEAASVFGVSARTITNWSTRLTSSGTWSDGQWQRLQREAKARRRIAA
jgi:putative DNA primase/helicase